MGELLICNGMLAAMPYYIENVSLNVYSLEELCYCMEKNTYLLEPDFMNEELCTWIEEEAGNPDLARRLRAIKNTKGDLKEFAVAILEETGWRSAEAIRKIQDELEETADKTGYECKKIRADKLVQNQKYAGAVAAYQELLQEAELPADFAGSVWHNLGTVYARLFFWQEAGECYRRAYALNQRKESLREWLMTYCCMRKEEEFTAVAKANCITEEEMKMLREEAAKVCRNQNVLAFEKELKELFYQKTSGRETEFEQGMAALLQKWEKDYRRICRK